MIYKRDKIYELRDVINLQLMPLIDNNYIYVDLPYHENLGDTLIWEGTLRFLKQFSYKCLYSTDKQHYKKPLIDKDVIILLHGGGNWGDLWPAHHEFRKKVITDFPDNRIIVFPQSVFYQENESLNKDIDFYNKYQNVIICVRDQNSYDILNRSLRNKILLIPDMAFFLNIPTCVKKVKSRKVLYARRLDKEHRNDVDLRFLPDEAEIHDWPTIEIGFKYYRKVEKLSRFTRKMDRLFVINMTDYIVDFYWKHVIRPNNVKTAIRFVDSYSTIYSTRLHISILAILLNKDLYVLDNNYGKTMNFLNTWF